MHGMSTRLSSQNQSKKWGKVLGVGSGEPNVGNAAKSNVNGANSTRIKCVGYALRYMLRWMRKVLC